MEIEFTHISMSESQQSELLTYLYKYQVKKHLQFYTTHNEKH